MERDEHVEALYEFIETGESLKENKEFYQDLSDALYACNERSLFGDTFISSEDAITIHKLLDALRNNRFPDQLKM